jgi:tRNA-specific 2-thiouridylase
VEKAEESGLNFSFIASGHYARVEFDSRHRYLLKKGRDSAKDQSYFLSFLSQQQLSRLLFPLGSHTKLEVRKMAADFGLPVAHKPDSQNFVCGDYSSVIKTGSNPGLIKDKLGNLLGQHKGIHSTR